MSRYSKQFTRNAVALYENNAELSLNSASAELGINRASLLSWVKLYGTGTRARAKAVFERPKPPLDLIDPAARTRGLRTAAKAPALHSSVEAWGTGVLEA